MSDVIDQLDLESLNRLILPKLFESQRGIDRLFLQKLLNLVYVTNDIWLVPHSLDPRTASDITANGAKFTAPVDELRIVFGAIISYAATVTVGTRNIQVKLENKGGSVLRYFLQESVTASQTRDYQLVGGTVSGAASVNVGLNFPFRIEPEWSLNIDDTANIDNLDDVSWQIEYLEVPL